MLLFGMMTLAGLFASIYYIQYGFLLNILDFSVAKMLHIDTMIIWLLMGFIGSVYWFLPIELERETEGIKLAEILFWIFCAAVAVVAAVFIFVQYGPATETSLWLINQGRKYVEAPRWAAIGVVLVVLVFVYNVVATAIKAKKITGIIGGADGGLDAAVWTLLDRVSFDHQPVGGPILVVVAGPSVGRGHLGDPDRLHHGAGADATAWYRAAHRRDVALHRGRPGAGHRHSRSWAPLLLDRDAGLLA